LKKELTYDPREHFIRDRLIWPLIILFIARPVAWFKGYQYKVYKPRNKTFLMLGNHNADLDPCYEMVGVRRYLRYVASDHVARTGFGGWLVSFFGTPIWKFRDRPSSELVKNIKDTLANGISVAMHAEGGTSFNGESRYILPNTARLIKEAGCALITYRMHGGYLVGPRWAKHARRGPLYGGVVREYDPEEIAAMTEDEIYEALCRDLYVNVYDEQRKDPQEYRGKDLAENCEIILYQCPSCLETSKLRSHGDRLSCDCGYEVEMREDGFFHDCGSGCIIDNICDWEHWQRGQVPDRLEKLRGSEKPVYHDEGQIFRRAERKKNEVISDDAVMELYMDRLEVRWDGGSWSASMEEILKMEFAGRQNLMVVTADDYFDITSHSPRSPMKYVDAWRYLTGRPNY